MTKAPLVVERGTINDLDGVCAVDDAAYPHSWSRKLLADDLTRDDRYHLVARSGGALIGHASLMTVTDEGHVTTVAVLPDHQRQGVARALMIGLCEHAVATGLSALTLEVRASNRPAHALYRRFGFAPVGARPGYYRADANGPKEDALIMWAYNIQSADYSHRLAAIIAQDRSPQKKDADHG